ncbi:hypothetical protein D3C74_424120 [compost metagenome]
MSAFIAVALNLLILIKGSAIREPHDIPFRHVHFYRSRYDTERTICRCKAYNLDIGHSL